MARRKVEQTKVFDAKKYIKILLDFVANNSFVKNTLIILVLISMFSLLKLLRLGPLYISPEKYISVTGTATSVESNESAKFMVTAKREDPEKDKAVEQGAKDVNNFIELVKNFGVDPMNIKTTSNNVYQYEKEPLTVRTTQKQLIWVSSTTIEVDLDDISKSSEFLSLINQQNNLEVYGPEYYLDPEKIDEARLLVNAIESAQEKAKFVAKNNGRRVGKILSIEENMISDVIPYQRVLGISSESESLALEPGSTKVTKSVIVKFELK